MLKSIIFMAISVDIDKLNQELLNVVEKRMALTVLSYDDVLYDKIEEQLHEAEDDFLKKYDDFLEDVLLDIHDEFCPDNEVLSPIAYVAKNYVLKENKQYDVTENQGVWVEIDELPDREAHLVILPNPLRIVLTAGNFKKIVWKANNN
ncbi:MAG: hypothetical protein ACK40K_01950 [Raineya sp.]